MVLKLDGKYYFIQLNWNGHFTVVFMLFFRSFALLFYCILHFNVLFKFCCLFFSLKNRLTELDSVSTVNRLMEIPLAPFIAQPGKN